MTANFYAAVAGAIDSGHEQIVLEADEGLTYTRADLARESARFAGVLIGAGAMRGDRIAVQVDKSPAALFLYLGCLRAGLVYLPLNTAYQRGEIAYFLNDAQPKVVVCRPQSLELLCEISAGGARVFTLDEHGHGSLTDAAAAFSVEFATVDCEPDDLAVIIYTSGTTGRSKGAMVTHCNLLSNARVLVDYWGFNDRDVLLHALPVFHIHGLFVANHCALLSGAKLLWHRNFDVKRVLRDLPRASVMMGVPTFYTRLLADPGFDRDACRNIRLFVSGSAPLQLDTFREFQRRTGQSILERYGMSEAGMICSNPLHAERRGGSVGFPLPGVTLRIADDQDHLLPAGEAGAIQIKGDNVFAGYWHMPEKTREEFTADAYFRTGDVGTIDVDGYVSIVGRSKDLIITGGYNVYPKEIEQALDALSGVMESAVIGIPHPDFGEAVAAVVVPKKEARLDPAALIAELKLNFAGYKVPKQIHLVEELPRNAMGKVQKALLRERFGK
ncbi:MAG: malonyl-CoA synthase [Betaproteobacteria bacterium]|jgi:malonyl-CoA/methylmalonyl-CoA synthetase